MSKAKKIALVVGGSGGIGQAVIQKLTTSGFTVCATFNSAPVSQETPVRYFKLAVQQPNEVQDVVKKITQEFGGIDAVVYAPTKQTQHRPLKKAEWSDFQEHLDVQIKGFFLLVKELFEQMKVQPIRFVVVLTEYCFGNPPVGLSDYVCAKYGLMGLAKALAVELAQYKSVVNMVSPGMTETKLIANLPAKLVELTATHNPLGRIAAAHDVAAMVGFLLSDEAAYLNGVNIPINGGSRIP